MKRLFNAPRCAALVLCGWLAFSAPAAHGDELTEFGHRSPAAPGQGFGDGVRVNRYSSAFDIALASTSTAVSTPRAAKPASDGANIPAVPLQSKNIGLVLMGGGFAFLGATVLWLGRRSAPPANAPPQPTAAL